MPKDTFLRLKEEKKQRIIDAALLEFNNKPFDKVTIKGIVDGTNIPKGSFYQYFDSLEDLYIFCYVHIRNKIITSPMQYKPLDFLSNHSAIGKKDDLALLDEFEAIGTISGAEHQFMINVMDSCPFSTKIAAICEDVCINLYPYWLQYFRQYELNASDEVIQVLTLIYSAAGLLSEQYSRVQNISSYEAAGRITQVISHLVQSYTDRGDITTASGLEIKLKDVADMSFNLGKETDFKIYNNDNKTLTIENLS